MKNHHLYRSALIVLFLLLVIGTVVMARAQSYPEPPAEIKFQRDVCYETIDGQTLTMDIASPKDGKGPYPAVICIHGGGWSAGHKKDTVPCAFILAQLGFVATSVDYRLVPGSHHPAQVQDVKAAVKYMVDHAAELNINPNKIGAFGSSAGGHLALMLGTTDSTIKAVASMAGPTDLTLQLPANSENIAERFIGKTRRDNMPAFLEASPVHYVNSGDAPVLMIHGTKDELVPYDQATTMLTACREAGVEAELISIKDGGHGGGGNQNDWNAGVWKMTEFFKRHLMN